MEEGAVSCRLGVFKAVQVCYLDDGCLVGVEMLEHSLVHHLCLVKVTEICSGLSTNAPSSLGVSNISFPAFS